MAKRVTDVVVRHRSCSPLSAPLMAAHRACDRHRFTTFYAALPSNARRTERPSLSDVQVSHDGERRAPAPRTHAAAERRRRTGPEDPQRSRALHLVWEDCCGAPSIDELPNFINVLRGVMSVVGPRPPLPTEVEHYNAYAMRRLSVKPGITCLWQITGRSNVSFEQWMELDNQYIDTWSPRARPGIVLRTIPRCRSRRRRTLSRRAARVKPQLRVLTGPTTPSPPRARALDVDRHGGDPRFVAARFLARGRQRARYFGTHWELDTFLATATIPTIIFGLFNGALMGALVPTFSDYLARGDDEGA